MLRPYLIDKPPGMTPLEAMTASRGAFGVTQDEKLAYAGRLDPLASGLLPVLYGAMLARQEEYWYLPKQYEATVLLGIQTDSYDLMGLPVVRSFTAPSVERMTAVIRGLVGKHDLSVPVYSSHRVAGKPLFAWAKEEGVPPEVPVRRMTVSQIDITGIGECSAGELLASAADRIGRVAGDFRQGEILAAWRERLTDEPFFPTMNLIIRCGSGTYIRSLANEIGRRLGTGAVLFDLRRTAVGP